METRVCALISDLFLLLSLVTSPFFNILIFPETNPHQRCRESPPVGLGDRVLNWVTSVVKNRKEPLGEDKITHDIRIVE